MLLEASSRLNYSKLYIVSVGFYSICFQTGKSPFTFMNKITVLHFILQYFFRLSIDYGTDERKVIMTN